MAGTKASSDAEVKKAAEVKEKSPWRGTTFTYSNAMSLLEVDDSEFIYGMSLGLAPRYYVRDDLSLRGRFSAYVELTDGGGVDHPQQWFVGDLSLEVNYAPTWLTIPVVGIKVNPYFRLYLPTGTTARRRNLIMGLAPGLNFSKSVKLMDGDWLPSMSVAYAFRAVKYLNEYTTTTLNEPNEVCFGGDPTSPSCQSTGSRNTSWSFSNSLNIALQIHKKVTFSLMAGVIDQLLYELEDAELAKLKGMEHSEAFGENDVAKADGTNLRVAIIGDVSLTYAALPWLNVTAGFSAETPQLQPDSEGNYPWLFNRFAQFHLDISIPIEPLVSQVMEWVE